MIDWDKMQTAEQQAADAWQATIASAVTEVQRHLDETAERHGYDDIKSAVTYAEEPSVPRFQQEGQAFRAWRSLCWDYCYSLHARIADGAEPMPETTAELIARLPDLELPQ